mmetsp:Transcript_67376/g.193689  ORF Transcript_67376/g.193689 Transcript_67376/m.193689 type:complete len:208 (+) Transcript_67376:659-1282(+)
MDAISMPVSLTLASFDSMDFERMAVSFFFAAMSSSNDLTAASSVATVSFWSFVISSWMVWRIPEISPLWGAYSSPSLAERKAITSWRSVSITSLLFDRKLRSTAAERVCRKPPAMPLFTAVMALLSAATLVLASAMYLSKVPCSFVRRAVASAMDFLAPARSSWCDATSFSKPDFLALAPSMAGPSSASAVSVAWMLLDRSPPLVLQ